MNRQWRFSEEESHAFFTAFQENAGNSRLKEYAGFRSIPLWLETFRGGARLVVAPAGEDEEFFPALVEQELLRLAEFGADDTLPCGCAVHGHRRALHQFRLKNLSP